MKCQQARIYLSPYLDSELDPTTTYEVSRHLEGCADCAQIFKAEEKLERAISEYLRRPQGDEKEVIERGLKGAFAGHTRFLARGTLFAAAALLLLVGLYATYRATSGEGERVPELIAMAAKDHRRYILGELAPEFLSTDPAAVASFFEGKLAGETGAFPVGDGWEVEGARVCSFRGNAVGFVTLRYHGIPVSVVDVPGELADIVTESGSVTPSGRHCFELPGGRGLVRRTPSGLRAVFGDVEMAKLEEVVFAAR